MDIKKQERIHRAGLEVRRAEGRLAEAISAMNLGYAKAQAEMERENVRLKGEVDRAALDVEREKSYLKEAEESLESQD